MQEGWDCPFAYVLTILTNPGSKSALTQLVGRILRQPYARKTRVSWLDECYVFCFQRRGADLLQEVRKGFGLEGLYDLEGRIVTDPEEGPARPSGTVTLEQRERYRKAARDLVLPAFMIKDGRKWRPVYYEADILSCVPWDEVDVSSLFDLTLGAGVPGDIELRAGLEGGPLLEYPERLETPDARTPAPGKDPPPRGASGGEIDHYFATRESLKTPCRDSGIYGNPLISRSPKCFKQRAMEFFRGSLVVCETSDARSCERRRAAMSTISTPV